MKDDSKPEILRAIGNLPATAPAKPKRTRGPNKPKEGAITVRTEATIAQAEIVKLLQAHVTRMLDADIAGGMELQVMSGDGTWHAATDATTAKIRFATKNAR